MRSQQVQQNDPGVQMLARLAGAALLWAVTLVGARWVLDDEHASRVARFAAVAVAVSGVIPWIWMTSRAILKEDEFTRRVHFVALSWAFAATGLFIYAVDLLTGAHLVDYVSYTTIWIFMVIAWWLSIVITTRNYR